jgi:hypothetical protein
VLREPDIPEGAETVTLDVAMEVYLRDQSDPIRCIGTFYFQREHLDDDDLVESFMSLVSNTLRSAMYDRSEPLAILSDGLGNKLFFETREVQAVSASAPEVGAILGAIGEGEAD